MVYRIKWCTESNCVQDQIVYIIKLCTESNCVHNQIVSSSIAYEGSCQAMVNRSVLVLIYYKVVQ